MNIGVVGYGVVGRAVASAWEGHCGEVRVWDREEGKRTHGLRQTCECDAVFVCLPTPQKDGELRADLTALHLFFGDLPDAALSTRFVLKSTVPIGTTRMLQETYQLPELVHSPEFLTARTAEHDAAYPTVNVVGVPGYPKVYQPWLADLYARRWDEETHKIKIMSSDESEAVKQLMNGFFAVKVAYWNEVRCLTDKLGFGQDQWDMVLDTILDEGRVDPNHVAVPGPDGRRGFGGACLPKDLASLVHQLDVQGLPCQVTAGAYHRNKHHDRKE